MESRKLYTLTFIVRDGRVLLGMKKRGFGMGRYNGFGGKVESSETIEQAAHRETKEECGISITTMEKRGIHEFEFSHKRGEILEVHVFLVTEYKWEPTETEEMKPEWFTEEDIPYETMWPDDRYWLPMFLEGKKFRTRFLFGEGDVVVEQHIREVDFLP
jgi:8-oxo-dGTP diphosphatase/2-hydroxy-dATP diphosphatase